MFNIFKSKTDSNIYAPVKGKCVDVTKVNDIGFASKLMGDGIAIIPEDNVIVAPCNGYLSMVFRTGHAFGIAADNGAELLVHIGIDTVNMEGRGFKILKQPETKVEKGEPIIEIDLDLINKKFDSTVMMIMTNKKPFVKTKIEVDVCSLEKVIEVE